MNTREKREESKNGGAVRFRVVKGIKDGIEDGIKDGITEVCVQA